MHKVTKAQTEPQLSEKHGYKAAKFTKPYQPHNAATTRQKSKHNTKLTVLEKQKLANELFQFGSFSVGVAIGWKYVVCRSVYREREHTFIERISLSPQCTLVSRFVLFLLFSFHQQN